MKGKNIHYPSLLKNGTSLFRINTTDQLRRGTTLTYSSNV